MTKQILTKPNVIFIVIDSLRARNLGCYGHKRATSPNIDLLAKNGVMFKNNFSTNNTTDNSYLSILSGRHLAKSSPIHSDIQKNLFYTKEELTSFFNSGGSFLQEILKKSNYKTYCLKYVHGWQKKGFDYYFNEVSRNPATGSKTLLSKIEKVKTLKEMLKKSLHFMHSEFLLCKLAEIKVKNKLKEPLDERSTNEAIDIIKKNKGKENFFMWVDYLGPHMPYNPGRFAGKFREERGAEKKSSISYDEAIFHNDYSIGEIIKTLKEENLLDNTIIFVFSDHGESLGEHGIFFDHHGMYDVSFNTPLIIHGGNLPTKKINALTQLEDLAPTVLDLLKIEYDDDLFDGKSMLPLITEKKEKTRDSIFMEECYLEKKVALRTKRYKYIESKSKKEAICLKCRKIHGGIIELYDLNKDPEENRNIAHDNKELLIEMKIKLNKNIKESKTLGEKRRLRCTLSKI